MKRIWMLLVFGLIAGCHSRLKQENEAATKDSIRKTILKINSEQQRLYLNLTDKKERSARYAEFCHDSLLTITGYGSLLTSAAAASQDLVDGYADTIHHITFRLYDNTAILTGQAKMFLLVNKDTLFEDIWISKVFMNFDGQWKMVLRNSGPLAVNYRKPVPVKPERLARYEGVYGLPGAPTDTFGVENQQLYQFGLNHLKIPYYPMNDSTFFTKDDLGTMVFRTDSKGLVAYFEWVLPDGQMINVPRK